MPFLQFMVRRERPPERIRPHRGTVRSDPREHAFEVARTFSIELELPNDRVVFAGKTVLKCWRLYEPDVTPFELASRTFEVHRNLMQVVADKFDQDPEAMGCRLDAASPVDPA